MADIVLGIGASHTTLMNTQWAKVDHFARAHQFRGGLVDAAQKLRDAKPDAIVIVGSNHFRGFWLDLMPAFTVGVGEVISSGEHGTPQGVLPSHTLLGQYISNGMVEQDFDLAFSTRLTVDHGISHAYQWIVADLSVPIVPIVVNCFAPPLPSLKRTRAFGVALHTVLRSAPFGRVAVIATGGLSHTLPFPDWRKPESDNDEFLIDSWREGRGRWKDFEVRRREIVVNAPPILNESFDRDFLKSLEKGSLGEFPDNFSDATLRQCAGNGASEVRAWQIMAAALGDQPGRTLVYSPMPEWLTGMAVALIPNGGSTR